MQFPWMPVNAFKEDAEHVAYYHADHHVRPHCMNAVDKPAVGDAMAYSLNTGDCFCRARNKREHEKYARTQLDHKGNQRQPPHAAKPA